MLTVNKPVANVGQLRHKHESDDTSLCTSREREFQIKMVCPELEPAALLIGKGGHVTAGMHCGGKLNQAG